jgi:DNA polymerase-3 subunit epsilon
MELAGHFTDARRLVDCCAGAGIALDGAHTALGDATATAALLSHYLRLAPQMGVDPFEALTQSALLLTSAPATPDPPVKARTAEVSTPDRRHLPLLAARGALTGPADEGAGAYLDLLARALADLDLDTAERADLRATAHLWGLDDRRVDHLHQLFLRQVGPHLNAADRDRLVATLTQQT